ncbi:TRIO and F-actin-binding protein [Clupea harengus]|uniref:TRIO and F-actin-binding protein n=1 Tax=Clupea harengus TaxID=7950 RepID=A0A6P8F744_CLUHA|nr:TRIO and F-actin-binding protein [Clupea harengus]
MPLTNLNFKKGWLFRLDEDDEWRKYWFVLTDLGLKYFIDSLAEERDEPEGEIDLSSCVDVIESDVEKNYGFQVHTKASVITLSAMTSRIRRNWIEILRRNIFSGNPPDQCHGSRAEIRVSKASSPGQDQDQDQDQESTLVTAPLTNQREAGEGRDREQEKKLEDRTKWFQEGVMMISDGLNSRWDTIELKKGTSQTTVQFAENIVVRGKDIDGKWEDFERLPFGEMKSPRLDGSSNYESTNEGEVSSPRQQRDASCFGKTEGSLSTGAGGPCVGGPCVGGPCVGGPCGPGAPCGPRLRTLEQLYKATLETAQKEHERQMEKLQKEKEYLLTEEAQAAAKTIEALKKAHRDELEDARRPAGREGLTERRKQSSEVDELQVELDGLSERYSEKCVELKHVQQNSEERNAEINRTETDIEHLRKENQELQSRLTEEITLMRSFITGQKSQSQFISHGNHEQSSDMEVLLRAKENEILYLKKEISCLRNEVASLTKEKESVCERFKEVYVELSRVKGASEREMGCLREHLSLTRAAMQEQQLMRNSS